MKKLLCTLLLLLGACSWRSPNSQFYMMDSSGLSQLSDKKMTVAVARIKVPDLLNRSQMVVYDTDNNQVNIMEFERWGEVLPDVLQNTIVNDLIAYLPQAYIQRTYFDSSNTQYSVNIEVNNLKAYRGNKVILSVWWTIINQTGKTILKKQQTYTAPVDGKSIQALVNAQVQAVHSLSKDIAENLLNL